MLVEFDTLSTAAHPLGRGLGLKEAHLSSNLACLHIRVFLHDPRNNAMGLDGLMNMNRGSRDIKTHTLSLACPLQGRIQMRIKLIGLHLFLCLIMLRHSNRRIVCTLFIIMGICFHVAHFCSFSICQLFLWTSHLFVLLLCNSSIFNMERNLPILAELNHLRCAAVVELFMVFILRDHLVVMKATKNNLIYKRYAF